MIKQKDIFHAAVLIALKSGDPAAAVKAAIALAELVQASYQDLAPDLHEFRDGR